MQYSFYHSRFWHCSNLFVPIRASNLKEHLVSKLHVRASSRMPSVLIRVLVEGAQYLGGTPLCSASPFSYFSQKKAHICTPYMFIVASLVMRNNFIKINHERVLVILIVGFFCNVGNFLEVAFPGFFRRVSFLLQRGS